jgi:uncharacterized membrane protein YdcZ (DUF606 family)
MKEDKKAACETYVEQTKMFVSLASLFVLVPGGLISLDKDIASRLAQHLTICIAAELFFVLSVLLGYLTLGSLAGSQDAGNYDVYRSATRVLSLSSVLSYLVGLVLFIVVVARIAVTV